MTSNTSTVRLITGASSGIGLALTRHWLAADQPVVAVSRHASTSPVLAELHGQGPLCCLDVDITDEKALRDLAAQLSERQLKPEQIIKEPLKNPLHAQRGLKRAAVVSCHDGQGGSLC